MADTRFTRESNAGNESLSTSINSLSNSVNTLGSRLTSLTRSTASLASKSIGVAAGMPGWQSGASLGATAISAVNPLVGQVVQKLVDVTAPKFSSSVIPMMKRAFTPLSMSDRRSAVKEAVKSSAVAQAMVNANRSQNPDIQFPTEMSIKNFSSQNAGRRLQNSSYEQSHSSADIVEALDRLRISNAEWLKASGSLTKSQLASKPVPRAAAGGVVTQSGHAIVHAGEQIVPAKTYATQMQVLQSIDQKLGYFTPHNQMQMWQSILMDMPFVKQFSGVIKPFLSVAKLFMHKKGTPLARGKAMRYVRQIKGQSALDKIADATSLTYGYLRFHMENLEDILQGKTTDTKTGRQEKHEGMFTGGPWEAIKGMFGMSKHGVADMGDVWQSFLRMGALREGRGLHGALASKAYDIGSYAKRNTVLSVLSQMAGFSHNLPQNDVMGYLWDDWNATEEARKSVKGTGASVFHPRDIDNMMSGRKRKKPRAALGGMVTKTGQATVHKGELIGRADVLSEILKYTVKIYENTLNTTRLNYAMMMDTEEMRKTQAGHWKWDEHYQQRMLEIQRKKEGKGGMFGTIATIIAAVVGLLAGSMSGVFSKLWESIPTFRAMGKGIFNWAKNTKAGQKISSGANWVKGKAVGAGKAAIGAFKEGGRFEKLGKMFGKMWDFMSKMFGKSSVLTKLFKMFGQGGRLTKTFMRFFRLGKTLGKFLGKMALPLQIVLSVFDGIKGWMNAGNLFDTKNPTLKHKIAAMVSSVLDGLASIFTMPINWILRKFGIKYQLRVMEPFIQFFKDMFTDPIAYVKETAQGIWIAIKETLGGVKDTIVGLGTDLVEKGKEWGSWLLKSMRAVVMTPAMFMAKLSLGVLDWAADKMKAAKFKFLQTAGSELENTAMYQGLFTANTYLRRWTKFPEAPQFKYGGFMDHTGPAMLHQGEMVIPSHLVRQMMDGKDVRISNKQKLQAQAIPALAGRESATDRAMMSSNRALQGSINNASKQSSETANSLMSSVANSISNITVVGGGGGGSNQSPFWTSFDMSGASI